MACSTEPQKRIQFSVELNLSENEFLVFEEVMKADETDRAGLANSLVKSSLYGMVEFLFEGQPAKMDRLRKLLKVEE